MTGSSSMRSADQAAQEYFHHSSGQRTNTDIVVVEALRKQYPNLDVVVAPRGYLNLLAYASAGLATITPLEDSDKDPVYGRALAHTIYLPPARRLDGGSGGFAKNLKFGKFLYKWKDHEFLLYIANGRDGAGSFPDITVHYILTTETEKAEQLVKEASIWGSELHNEVWVFDGGWWQKSSELWRSVEKSHWSDVILEEGMKKAIIDDVENFFDNRETYEKLKVPWKRGIIYYGPPGNGKTISIKAMMHALYQRGVEDDRMSVPTLYVRSLVSFAGPEYALNQIFTKARQTAPCYLVFEDLDSIVNDRVRSYFLNEVDGLKSNDGILMVGSTNHLDRLDPGISKRPSRFDRKYYFPDPDYDQRVQYAKFWQNKLKDNDDLDFPDELCSAAAKITDKFSFAYMQEAFVASLLAIAVRKDNGNPEQYAGPDDPVTVAHKKSEGLRGARRLEESDDSDLDDLALWKEFQKQVHILREEMDEKAQEAKKKKAVKVVAPGPEASAAQVHCQMRPRVQDFNRGRAEESVQTWIEAQDDLQDTTLAIGASARTTRIAGAMNQNLAVPEDALPQRAESPIPEPALRQLTRNPSLTNWNGPYWNDNGEPVDRETQLALDLGVEERLMRWGLDDN